MQKSLLLIYVEHLLSCRKPSESKLTAITGRNTSFTFHIIARVHNLNEFVFQQPCHTSLDRSSLCFVLPFPIFPLAFFQAGCKQSARGIGLHILWSVGYFLHDDLLKKTDCSCCQRHSRMEHEIRESKRVIHHLSFKELFSQREEYEAKQQPTFKDFSWQEIILGRSKRTTLRERMTYKIEITKLTYNIESGHTHSSNLNLRLAPGIFLSQHCEILKYVRTQTAIL